jgi:dCMP deaminase
VIELDKWDERFIRMAEHISTWSRDPSTQVGSVIVRPDKTIASLGFNGLPRHIADTPARLHDRDLKMKIIIHAETNSILNAREPLAGFTIYVFPFHPCSACAAAIIQAGIKRVVCPVNDCPRWAANFELARMMFSEAGVAVDMIDTPIV